VRCGSCGSGSLAGRRPSLGGYVTGTGATGGARRRRTLMLPIPWRRRRRWS